MGARFLLGEVRGACRPWQCPFRAAKAASISCGCTGPAVYTLYLTLPSEHSSGWRRASSQNAHSAAIWRSCEEIHFRCDYPDYSYPKPYFLTEGLYYGPIQTFLVRTRFVVVREHLVKA